jgi:hypothetical protein
MLSENSKIVFEYVLANDDKNFTVADIADATGLPKKSVEGIVTAAFCNHKNAEGVREPLMVRVPAEIELPDGTHKAVKFVHMTEAGKAFDVNAVPADK